MPAASVPASGYARTGLCFWCLLPLESIQPGGLQPRHVDTTIPYGCCASAIDRRRMTDNEFQIEETKS